MFGTGFASNQYETDSQEVRHKFEQMGEIKIFFDLISTRGMAFITYVSMPSLPGQWRAKG
jgi:hypothetical protein